MKEINVYCASLNYNLEGNMSGKIANGIHNCFSDLLGKMEMSCVIYD